MRHRAGLILLIVLASQCIMVLAGWLPLLWREACQWAEDLADLVVYQAHQSWPWLSWRHAGRRERGDQPRGRRRRVGARPGLAVAGTPPQPAVLSDQASQAETLLGPQSWGLPPEASQELPARLQDFWQRFATCFKTQTRDTSAYALHYLSGLLRLESQRTYVAIGRTAGVAGENVQHFMSNSPWSAHSAMAQVRQELKAPPELAQGSVLLLDESADEKAGGQSAGAGRQYNGRLGKVEMSQVGTFLAYANLTRPQQPLWAWVDGELYLPEQWFTAAYAELRQQLGIPAERQFATKIELGWQMIQRVQAEGLAFDAVACDDLYGRSTWLRDQLAAAEITYMADVPSNTQVYIEKPLLGIPEPRPDQRGRKPTDLAVLNGVPALTVRELARHPATHWQRLTVRPVERGELNAPFAARRVWTRRDNDPDPVQEWLLLRRDTRGRESYALSNAPADTPLAALAWLKCQRYFVERANQDAKSETGWAELQARKFRAWEHHLALVILAIWFLAHTRWEWTARWPRDPALTQHFTLSVLPALSMANIRILLRAALPLPQPTPEEARALVVAHLVNRTRSRKSRLKRQRTQALPEAVP